MKIEKVKEFMNNDKRKRSFKERFFYFLELFKEKRNREQFILKNWEKVNYIRLTDKIVIWWIPFHYEEWKSPESLNIIEDLIIKENCQIILNVENKFWYLPFYDYEYIDFINEWESSNYSKKVFFNELKWIKRNWYLIYSHDINERILKSYKEWKWIYIWSDSSLVWSIIFVMILLKVIDWLSFDEINKIKLEVSEKYKNREFILNKLKINQDIIL